MSGSPFGGRQPVRVDHIVNLRVSGFAWEAIEQESARQGCTVEELVAFAVMYYLADADSGRIARQISRSPYPDASAPSDASPEDPWPYPESPDASS
ncbi:MAG TPA: hypothetical protein VK655_00550 [Solirubrobacteraceae bacterium]|jgi:hypothetical protein|nr:hypothetical protein [Solirubrobacteraceae bacterium]